MEDELLLMRAKEQNEAEAQYELVSVDDSAYYSSYNSLPFGRWHDFAVPSHE